MPRSRSKYSRIPGRSRRNVRPLEDLPDNRFRLVFAILLLGLSALIGRMAWLQVLQAPELEAKARSFQTQKIQPLGTRRSIVDRMGRLVAIDEEHFRLWAHPRYFNFPGDSPTFVRSSREVANKLSPLLSTSIDNLMKRLGDQPSGVRLADGISSEVASEIRSLGISGLDLEAYPQRIYPQGTLFANVVGFLNQERIPQAGLEQSLNDQLLRKEKARVLRRGADGTPLPADLAPGVFYGDDLRLHLTLDARLQELAVKALSTQVEEWNAKKGVAIVMDVTNGELLVLASTPTYDPNKYWEFSPALFREWSVQDLFEPGSTFKPINLALALEERAIDPNGLIEDTGSISVGGWSIYNHDKRANGLIDFAKVLQVSSNVGMVKIMSQLQPSSYWDWLYRLGLSVKPETDLPGAVAGQLKNKEKFVSHSIEPATASYGQGFSLTPLKLAQLHALIANGGYLVHPHITKGLKGGDLTSFNFSSNKSYQLLRNDVTQKVLEWMETVVEDGSGKGVKTPGYRIGGKTGTAQKASDGAYKPGAQICSFVASLPLESPRYVVLVVIDEPQGPNAYGSTVAVPVAKKIIDSLLVLQKIPPSSDSGTIQLAEG